MSSMGYPSDVKDAEWDVISPLLPKAKTGGRPQTTFLRKVVNAIFYVSRGGGAWRMLPKDFLLTRRFTATSGLGARTVPGRRFMMPFEIAYARRRDVRLVRAQPRLTARALRRRKKGIQRVRCGEENQRTQAASGRRHARVDCGSRCSSCRYPRPRWSQTGFEEVGCPFSSLKEDLG